MTNPLVGPSALRDLIHPQFHQNNFPEEVYIKNELGIRLDKGTAQFITLDFYPHC
jgi:cleavage and polyadenylation specificity factor subunit 4